MNFSIDYTTVMLALEAVRFAIDECDNRILEAHDEGKARTSNAWRLIKKQHERTLDKLIHARQLVEND